MQASSLSAVASAVASLSSLSSADRCDQSQAAERAQAARTAIEAAPAVASAIGEAADGKAVASEADKQAARSLWQSLLLLTVAANGHIDDFNVHVAQFEAAGRPAHIAATKARTGKEPKNWKTALNRASDLRLVMSEGFDPMEPLPVNMVFEDPTSEAAIAYEMTMPEHGPVTQREVQAAVGILRAQAAKRTQEARLRLYPVSVNNPSDWTADNLETLQAQHFDEHETLAAVRVQLTHTQNALTSALQGDASADEYRLAVAALETRIAERDELVRGLQAELSSLRQAVAAERHEADEQAA
jgi:hypothetical protein